MRMFYWLLLLLFCCLGCKNPETGSNAGDTKAHLISGLEYDSSLKPFYYGVASGDPMPESVVIWTKVVPEEPVAEIPVQWEIALDSSFSKVVQSGSFSTDSATGHTVKVEAKGLSADQYYYYRFQALEQTSMTGRTKTAPEGDAAEVQFAVVSCNNFEGGYFTAFGKIAGRDDLDAVIHLGDYIYEYGPGVYGDSSNQRFHVPAREIVTLSDYRTRYAQYRLDKDLMRIHQMHPFITVWDDHEIANNTYTEGAQNHQPEEGPFEQRRQAAVQAYFEWMPVRDNPENKLYRSFRFGNLAELMMLDERLAGRDQPVDSISDPAYESTERSLLGEEQFQWLSDRLLQTEARWKILGNQVIFSDLNTSVVYSSPRNLDAWDGYPASQQQLAGIIQDNKVENVIILSGDTHASWAFETVLKPTEVKYNPATGRGAFAVEFGTPSISSGNMGDRLPRDTVALVAEKLMQPQYNPHLKYVNLSEHGYLLLTLKPEEAVASWYFVEDIQQPQSAEYLAKTYRVAAGEHHLQEAAISP